MSDSLDLTINDSGQATLSGQQVDSANDLTAIARAGTLCVTVGDTGNVLVLTDGEETWGGKLTLSPDLARCRHLSLT